MYLRKRNGFYENLKQKAVLRRKWRICQNRYQRHSYLLWLNHHNFPLITNIPSLNLSGDFLNKCNRTLRYKKTHQRQTTWLKTGKLYSSYLQYIQVTELSAIFPINSWKDQVGFFFLLQTDWKRRKPLFFFAQEKGDGKSFEWKWQVYQILMRVWNWFDTIPFVYGYWPTLFCDNTTFGSTWRSDTQPESAQHLAR